MSLITTTSLSKSFGDFALFSGISFSVAKGARMALVGPNGVGKTTLLRILVGEDEASSGTVATPKGVRIGYLPQEADFDMDGTLWESCESVFSNLQIQQDELHRLEALMANPDQAEEVLERCGKLQHDFEEHGGYNYPTRIKQVLTGLGFDEDDYALRIEHLSGGQRTRAFLARLLLSDPDLLLLDEPTEGLAPLIVRALVDNILRLKQEGLTVLLAEQNLMVALELSDRAYIIDNGAIRYHGTSDELRADEVARQKYLCV